jgi:hypothetical protein
MALRNRTQGRTNLAIQKKNLATIKTIVARQTGTINPSHEQIEHYILTKLNHCKKKGRC